MPWHVAKSSECPASSPWAVIKDDTGAVEGCHATKRDAQDQMAALYAQENGDSGSLGHPSDDPQFRIIGYGPLPDDTPVGMTEDEAYAFLRGPNLAAALDPMVEEEGEYVDDDESPATQHTGAMIALVPSMPDVARILVPDGEPAEQLHLTLWFLGDAVDYDETTRAAIVAAVQETADGQSAIQGEAFGVAAWNPLGDEPCLVLNVGGGAIEKARHEIGEAVGDIWAAMLPEQHCPFSPHVTLSYGFDNTMIEAAMDTTGPIVFDRIRVAFGDSVTDVPLYNGIITAGGDMQPTDAKSGTSSSSQTPEQEMADQLDSHTPGDEQAIFTSTGEPGEWEGVLCVEGIESGDGRMFAANSLDWEVPSPLSWQIVSQEGHDESIVVGRIDQVARIGTRIRAKGVFNLNTPDGADAYKQLVDGFIGGVSVDVDSVKDADVELVFPPSDAAGDDEDLFEMMFAMPELMIFHKGRIRGATMVSIPAFVEAKIFAVGGAMDSPMASGMGMAASAADELADVPVNPPDEWFADPQLDAPTPITVTADGRVFGHAALWSSCHLSFPQVCTTPPKEGDHVYYRLGEIVTASGTSVPVGQITLGTGHAALDTDPRGAVEHYDHTGTSAADVASGEDEHGIWVAGALRPGLTQARVRELRGAKLSGDWRRIGGKLRLVALLAVNVPGFGVPRLKTHVANGIQASLIAAGLVPSVAQLGEDAQRRALQLLASGVRRRLGVDVESKRAMLRARLAKEN
jgi:2'-5' RNA ligase